MVCRFFKVLKVPNDPKVLNDLNVVKVSKVVKDFNIVKELFFFRIVQRSKKITQRNFIESTKNR